MRSYLLTWLSFVAMAIAINTVGLVNNDSDFLNVSLLLFPIPVAYYWAQQRTGMAWGMVAGAALAGGLVSMNPWIAAIYAIAAAFGMIIGQVLRRRWSYGWCVATLTALMFCICLTNMLWHWEIWGKFLAESATLREQGAKSDTTEAMMAQWLRYMSEHREYVTPGLLFGMVLFAAVTAVAITTRWLRKISQYTGPGTPFRELAPPDWLVWVAIAAALVGIADQRWPNDVMRIFSWNTGLALSFIYALNGVSIAAYAIKLFQLQPVGWYVALFIFVYFAVPGINLLVLVVGFFDTWYGFRRKFDRLAELRRLNKENLNS